MELNKIIQEIKDLIAKSVGFLNSDAIDENVNLQDQLDIDSLEWVFFVIDMEGYYDVDINDMENIGTITDLAKLIKKAIDEK
jgi:acyl carrier protein